MAKMTNTSTIKIMLDGSQAENEVQRLRKQLKGVGEELAIVQEKFKGEREWDSGDTAEKLSKRIKELKKTQRSLKSALDAHITQITGVDSVLADRSAAAYNELTKKRTSLLNLLKRLRLDTEEEMRVYEETSKRLSKIQQEIGERDIDLKSPTTVARAQEVLARPEDYSTKEINEAIAAMTKFRDTKKADSEEWKHWNGYVRNGALFMEEFNQKVKTTNMEELHADLKNAKPTISDKDLNVLVKYWEEMAQGAKTGSTAQADFNKKLAEARDLQTARKREQGEKIVTEVADQGQFGSSLSEMQQRLKLLQDYRTVIDSTKPDAYVRVDAAIEKLTQKIKESQAGFLSYADAMKQSEGLANGTFKGSISDLDKIKKVLEEYKGTLSTSDTAGLDKVNTALGNIEQKQKELQSGYISYSQAMIAAAQVMNGSFDGSLADLEKLQKVLTEYRNSLDVKDTAGLKDVDTRLEAITKKMQELRPGFMSFQDALAKAGEVSAGTFDGTIEDLEKIQKTLKEGMESELSLFKPNDIDQMKQAQEAMENIANKRKELAQLRLSEKAESTMSDVENDIWDGTIKETQEAIKLLQEYRTTLKTTDAAGLKRVDDALEKLGVKTKQAEKGFISLDEALKQAGEVQAGTFKGTIEDLQKLKKTLEELRKTKVEIGDKDGLKKVDEALFVVESKLKDTTNEAVTLDEVLNNLDKANFNQLQMAAKALEEELKNMSESADDFAEKSEKLRNVEKRMDELKKKWETHDNVIMKTAKRLMAYVAVYGGFNEILSQMKELISLNLKLSDSMADVQKTTGLAGVELQELGRDIERIDSRTSTDRLYEIAAAAGQIGLKTQQDVLGFTKAANTITVALNELGTEGAANLMKIATLTGEVANYGTEGALMRVGSAINELTANSAATAGPITDFIGRVGGIASASKIAISEMAALGAVTDASAQSIEIAGTSMNKFISALMSNTENIAYAANISVKDLQELINNGQTMEAVVRVLESMQTMSRGAQSALLKELGSEGARMNQYVAALVSNLDMLKEQLAISRDAFEENVSVINEYNVKQESAAGILERMKNSFKDAFVNSRAAVGMVTVLENISKLTSKIVNLISNSYLTDIGVGIINWTSKLLAWTAEFKPALIAIETVVVRLMLLNIHKWLFGVGTSLSGVVGIIKTAATSALVGLRNALAAVQVSFITASAGATGFSAVLSGLKGVVMGLWAAFKANPLGWIATIAGVVISVFHVLGEAADKLGEEILELNKKHTREIQELYALRDALESTATSYGVKAAALEKLNSLYSKYLGFQLSEIDSYEKKAAALDLVTEKLKEQQALEEKNRRKEHFTDEFGKESAESMREMEKVLVDIPKIGRMRWVEAMDQINQAVKNGTKDTKTILLELAEYFDISADDEMGNKFAQLRDGLEDYVKSYAKYQENIAATDLAYDHMLLNSKANVYEKLSKLAEAHQNDIAALEIAHQKKVQDAEEKGRKISEQEQIAHLQALKRENEQYLETAKKMQEYWKEEDAKKLKDPMVANEDGSVIPSMVGALYGHAASREAKEYNELLKERNSINEAYLATADKVKKAEEALAAVEAQRKENWETPEEEDAYIASLNKAKAKVEEEKANRDKLYKDLKATNVLMNEQFQELSLKAASSARKQWTDTIETVEAEINSLAIRIAGDPYGKGFNVKSWKDFGTVIENLDTSSVDALAAAYKKLRDESKTITADVEAFNKMFDPKTPKKNLDELNEQVLDWANQIRQELMSRGRGVTGEFLFGEGKEGYDQVLEQLKTHFLKQQKQLRESYLKGLMTGPELKRRLDANNKEFLNARVELNKLMLGQASNFDQTLYPELAEANLSKIARTLFTAGEEIRTQIEQSLEEDKNTILEGAIKIREEFEKEVTKVNPFGELNTKFRDMLDGMSLMSSEWERSMIEPLEKTSKEVHRITKEEIELYNPYILMNLDKEGQDKRFKLIREFAAKSYTVDVDGLKKMMKAHEGYYDWIANLSQTELENLLQASRWYYDQELLALKSRSSEIKKMVETAYNQSDLDYSDSRKYDWMIKDIEGRMEGIRKTFQEKFGADDTTYLNDQDYRAHKIQLEEFQRLRDDARKRESDKAKSHRHKMEREAKEQMEASISALQAYYNEQEAMIRKNALERGASQATLDRELLKNTLKREKDEIELRKKLLGEASEFDPNANDGYRGVITGTEFFGKNKTNEVLAKQAKQIAVWGKALQDGIRNQIAKGEITIQEALQKERDKIEKVLLEDDFNAKVAEEYLESIDTLGLLFNIKSEDMKDMDKELGESRLAYMREWAKESYNLNAQQLQAKIEQEAAFSKWRIGRTAEDYEALLIQLRKFHDDEEEADRKAAERRKKIFDNSEQGRKLQEKSQQSVNEEENEGEMWDRFKDLDLVSEDTTDQAQIDVYQAKIDASRAYIEQIKLEMQAEIDRARANVLAQQATLQALEMMGVATDEQQGRLKQAQAELDSLLNQQGIIIAGENEKILENQKNAADRYMAIEQRKVQEAKKYTDAIIEFSGQMGEAAFGEVEDRKEAGKQLIKTLLTTLKDWIQVKTTELVMQQLFSDQSTAISGQQVGKELGMTASKTSADIAAGTASATAKEAGSKGFIGLAVGAAIGAALSALLGLALGAINKSKTEVQSISGTGGRLATGMLTYAEGNYPVLGNDGNVYNAKYEGSGMKTGIYRGGAHFGIFSEKKPEAIIDGDTTQRLIMNHPDIWKAIVTLSKNGRLDSGMGMRTFATGNINDLARQAQDMEASATTDNSAQMAQMQATLDRNSQVMAQLMQVLAGGIKANINMYGEDGMYKSMKKAEKYAGRVGYK